MSRPAEPRDPGPRVERRCRASPRAPRRHRRQGRRALAGTRADRRGRRSARPCSRPSLRGSPAQVEDHRLHALVDGGFPGRPSLRKIAWISFSTVRSLRRAPPRSLRCSCPSPSRGGRRALSASARSAENPRAGSSSATSASTTFGSTTDPPSATARIAATSSPTSWTRSLSRYARRSVPASKSASAYAGSRYWLSTTTPTSGCSTRNRSSARIPSSRLPGGMRMSVTTTSGRSASTAASSESRSSQTAATAEVRARLEQSPQPLAKR